jgi:hypothetical protein
MTETSLARQQLMEAMNCFYARMLEVGFMILGEAIYVRDWEWADVERQLLHNVPSLLNELNVERHRYFWEKERQMYIEWIDKANPHQKLRMTQLYAPVWEEMEPVVQEFLDKFAGVYVPKWCCEMPAPSTSG